MSQEEAKKTQDQIDELAQGDEPTPPAKKLADTGEDKAVEEIERKDQRDHIDETYEQESNPEEPLLVIGEEKHKFLAHLKRPAFWVKVCLLLVVMFIFAWLITPSRLWMLNAVGLRGSLDVTTTVAVDQGIAPMLKNATITINGIAYHTNDQGKLHAALPYGFLHIVVSKQGYASATKDETLDFDPFFDYLGGKQADQAMRNLSFAMKSVGIAINFSAKDWLTGQAIFSGQFTVGDVVAQPDPQGNVALTIPATDAKTVDLIAKFDSGYANTTVSLALQSIPPTITFAPAGKDYFISKRSGQYVIYGANLDGSNLVALVPGSANETGGITFSTSASGKYGVLASTREATHDNYGATQQKLYVVDTTTGKLTPMDAGLQFSVVDWQGDTVVYKATEHAASGITVTRLASLNIVSGVQTNLATVSGVSVARLTLGNVVYLTDTGELHIISIKGGTDKSLGTNISKITQSDATSVAYLSGSTWAQYNVNTAQTSTIAVPASATRAFLASNSQDNQTQLVADTVDGTLALIAKAVAGGQETRLYTGGDLSPPLHWVGNVVVYRAGAADYVVSPSGGAPKKIADVSPSSSRSNDYFIFN